MKIKAKWLIYLISFCMPTKTKTETWEFKKYIRLLTVFYFFQKPCTICGLILLHIFSIFINGYLKSQSVIVVVLQQSDKLCSNTACTLFLFTAEPQKKMFIIDRAVTHSCHVFVLFCMSYLHCVLFHVICIAAFSCSQLRSAPKGQILLISVPTAQKQSVVQHST